MLDVIELDLKVCKFESVDELRLPLVNRFYSRCDYRVKCGRFERTYCLSLHENLRLDRNIIAAARLIPQRSGCFLLRNLCVAPDMRNQGVATHLVAEILTALGSAACYCYALPHLQKFYTHLNFKVLAPEEVPSDIGDMYRRHRERKRGWILMGFVPSHHDPDNRSYKEN